MRILYLVPCSPAGRAYGTMLRVRQIGTALRTLGDVDTVVVAEEGEPIESDTALPVRRVVPLRRLTGRSALERVRCGFDATFLGHHGRGVDPADRAAVLRDLPDYDLIWICHLSTADVFGQWHWPRSVLDVDDIPSEVLRTQLVSRTSPAARLRAHLRLPVARRRERLAATRFTTLCVCSDADRRYLGSNAHVHVIPNGFPTPAQEPRHTPAAPPRIGFVGTCDYAPNADAINWFLRESWPAIVRARPDVRLRIIGKSSDDPAIVRVSDPRVDPLGWVANAEEEIATWSAMIVPLRSGGGTRVKIAEGLGRKCPIVATTFGAHGYDAANGSEMRLADTADGFAAACIDVVSDPRSAAAMAERGWKVFLDKWTWDALQPRVLSAADACLRMAHAA